MFDRPASPTTLQRLRRHVAAVDPGRARWRTAFAATTGLGVTIGAEYVYAHLVGRSGEELLAMILGGVGVMQVSALMGPATGPMRWRVAGWHVLVVVLGLLVDVAVRDLTGVRGELVALTGVTFVAVAARQLGPQFIVLGLMGWTAYFIGSFGRPGWDEVPLLLGAIVLAACCSRVLSAVLWRSRTERALGHGIRSWEARVQLALLDAARLLRDARSARIRVRLARRSERVATAALVVEGWLSRPVAGVDPAQSHGWRDRMIETQATMDALVDAVLTTEELDEGGRWSAQVADAIDALLAGDPERAAATARAAAAADDDAAGPGPRALLTDAIVELAALRRAADEAPVPARGAVAFAPAVTLIGTGSLGGTAGLAPLVTPGGVLSLRRASLPLRQATQAALAVALATVIGYQLSVHHVYWAVLAVFIVFLGTPTRAETLTKGLHRFWGTVLGAAAAIPVAALTDGRPIPVLVVVLLACLLGHYLMEVAYGYLMAFITVGVVQMYDLMHAYDLTLLVTRTAETALGALIAVAVVTVVAPVRHGDVREIARTRYLETIARALDALGDALKAGQEPDWASLRGLAREADDHARLLQAPGSANWLRRLSGDARELPDHGRCSRLLRQLATHRPLDGVPVDVDAATLQSLAAAAHEVADAARGLVASPTEVTATTLRSRAQDPGDAALTHPIGRHVELLRDALDDLARSAAAFERPAGVSPGGGSGSWLAVGSRGPR